MVLWPGIVNALLKIRLRLYAWFESALRGRAWTATRNFLFSMTNRAITTYQSGIRKASSLPASPSSRHMIASFGTP